MGAYFVIDRGNSRTKFGIYSGGKLIKVLISNSFSIDEFKHLLSRYRPEAVILSAVTKVPKTWLRLISSVSRLIILDSNTPLPIKNAYKSPKTLGSDRIAAAVAAHQLFPGKPVLAIDAGTCIKYDFVDAKGYYRGGSISPGLRMRFKAMHQFTDKLPLSEPKRVRQLIGADTKESMLTGVVIGAANEIDGFVERYRKVYPGIKVVITGGDALFLSDHLKLGIFATPELVLDGLYHILLHAIKSS